MLGNDIAGKIKVVQVRSS